jgi:hypothetical protein
VRDARLQSVAAHLQALPPERVHKLQGDFQYALLLHCDPAIYDTLAPETIAAVDDGLEALFDLEDIGQDNHWEPLVYTYGFFNRDVTPGTIREVLAAWDALSDEEKAPRYPTYIHVIDAVCKPVSMGPIGDRATTRDVLEIVMPVMKAQLLREPAPGTAFHPASHACLVLGPLYDRWADDPDFGPLVREHLGTRDEFEAMMASPLPGGPDQETPLSDMAYGYYGYIASYLANTLARLDARSTIPALERSLTVHEARGAQGRAVAYTRRALLALGQPEAREAFEEQLADPGQRDDSVKTLVWLARNGQGETKAYAEEKLGDLLGSPPGDALETYFQQELDALRGE